MTHDPSTEGPTTHSVLLLIGRMDGKLDLLLTRHDQHERQLQNLERRIRALEAWKSKAVGWLAAAGAAGGAATAQLPALLSLLH